MYYDGVTSVISISFSCGTQLFTIQWRDPEPGWSAKHSIAPSQHRFRSKCRLPAYWKERGTLPEIKPCGRYWERSCTRQRRTITHPGDVTMGVTLQEARPQWVINKPARGCDVILVTGPMFRTGELQLRPQTHINTHRRTVRLTSQRCTDHSVQKTQKPRWNMVWSGQRIPEDSCWV